MLRLLIPEFDYELFFLNVMNHNAFSIYRSLLLRLICHLLHILHILVEVLYLLVILIFLLPQLFLLLLSIFKAALLRLVELRDLLAYCTQLIELIYLDLFLHLNDAEVVQLCIASITHSILVPVSFRQLPPLYAARITDRNRASLAEFRS